MSVDDASGVSVDSFLGRVIDGRYRIVRPIGKGGMGVVYEALHLTLGCKVAVKFGYASATRGALARFQREAQAAAAVGSAHVVEVIDMGRLDAGTSYIVLEHLEGTDLGFALATQGAFSRQRALHIVLQMCDALLAVHARGIVHRDLKPENVFLIRRDGRDDFVKLLDFGVCKYRSEDDGRLTASGDTIGTPEFMAPEQAEGRSDVDHRADIYALGAIFYFMLTDKPLFAARRLPQLLIQICHQPAPHLLERESGMHDRWDGVLQRALDKDPNRRFQSCAELKSALLSLSADVEGLELARAARTPEQALALTRTVLIPPLPRPARLGLTSVSALLAVGLIALAFSVLLISSDRTATKPPHEAAAPAQTTAESPRPESEHAMLADRDEPAARLVPAPEVQKSLLAPAPARTSAASHPLRSASNLTPALAEPPRVEPPVAAASAEAQANSVPAQAQLAAAPVLSAPALPFNRPLKDGI